MFTPDPNLAEQQKMNLFLGVEWNDFASDPGNAEACEIALHQADTGTRRYLPSADLDNLPDEGAEDMIRTRRRKDAAALETAYLVFYGLATCAFVFGVLPVRNTTWEGVWACLAIQFFAAGVLLSHARDQRNE